MIKNIIFIFTAIIFLSSPVVATNLICTAKSYFDSENNGGMANFAFTISFEEKNGAVESFKYSNLLCEYFNDISFGQDEIYIDCGKAPLPGMQKFGDYLYTYKINRLTGSFSRFGRYTYGEQYTVYEGLCKVGSRKF